MTVHDLLVLFADPATQLAMAIGLLCVIAAGIVAGLVASGGRAEAEAEDGEE